jgi:hypothetical protein
MYCGVLLYFVNCRNYDNSTNLHIGVTDTNGKVLIDAYGLFVNLTTSCTIDIENTNDSDV